MRVPYYYIVVYILEDEKRIRALEDELARLKAQMARLSLEQIEKSESKGMLMTVVLNKVTQ